MLNTRVVLAGLIASMVMGMVQMAYEAVAGSGFWAPVVFIAATILPDLQGIGSPVPFLAIPVVLGLMGHMMNSIVLSVVFARLVATQRLRRTEQLATSGAVYGLAVFAAMWLVVVPPVDPALLRLNGAVFAVAHLLWGAALGLALAGLRAPAAAAPAAA